MEATTTAALIFLLCSQTQNTGAFPVRNNPANYQHDASGSGKQGSFGKETVAAMTANENPPCQIVPVTDAPLTRVTTTTPPPIPVNKPGQNQHQTVPLYPPAVNNPGGFIYQKHPLPLPPNVFYQPIMPYYIPQHKPVSGGSYVYGQGAGNVGFIPGGGQLLLPHSPPGGSGLLPAPQWFLDLQRRKHLPVSSHPQNHGNPTGNQRGSLQAKRLDSSSSEMSSEEDSDGD